MNAYLCYLCLGLAIAFNGVNAETQRVAEAASPTNISAPEVTLLKTQIAVMKEYDTKLLSTVHLVLGTLATVFFILLGYNWIVNYRQYHKDKEDIEKTLKDGLEGIKQAMSLGIQKEMPNLSKKAVEAGEAAAKNLRAEVERRFSRIDLKDTIAEAKMWRDRKVFGNSIRHSCKAASMICDSGPMYELDDHLKLVRQDIKDISAELLSPNVAADITSMLKKLPPTYATEIESLSKLVAEKTASR